MTDFSTDDALGLALVDLGAHVAAPARALWTRVQPDLADEQPPRSRHGRVLVAIAVVIVLLLAAVVSIAPARRAVADFLGIGSTEIRRVDRPRTGASPDALPRRGDEQELREDLERAGLGLPDATLVGPPMAWRIAPETDAGSGETVVAFADVVLSQRPEGGIPAAKLVPPGSRIESATVGDRPALWISGPHTREIGGRVYRSASALLWVDRGIELRLEGDLSLDRMLEIARSVQPVGREPTAAPAV